MAAGKGTRMDSDLPKALSPLGGKPMIKYLLDTIAQVYDGKPIVIVGHKAELIKETLGDTCEYALQKEQLGTGHAVESAKDYCMGAEAVVVLSGDQPFVKVATIKKCLEKYEETKAKITFTTTEIPDFLDWRKYFIPLGRILRTNNEVVGIREYRDANEIEKEIREINTACCYVFDANWLWENIPKIKMNETKHEYYLTDLFHIAYEEKEKIETIKMSAEESMGANSKEDLSLLQKFTN